MDVKSLSDDVLISKEVFFLVILSANYLPIHVFIIFILKNNDNNN